MSQDRADAPEGSAGPSGPARRAAVGAAALVWILALVLLQLELGTRLVVVPWLALGPLVAGLVLRWRATAVPAAAGILAVAGLSAWSHDLTTGAGSIRVLGVAALAGFAVASSAVRVRREERIRRVTRIATAAQAAILPPLPVRVGDVALASRYASATRGASVGGDLYDAVAVAGDGVRVVLGDARGKGLGALRTSAAVLSAFRHCAPDASLDLAALARQVEAHVRPGLEPEDFATAVFVHVHPDGAVDLASCGHPPPLLLVPGAAPLEVPVRPCPPIGLGADPVVSAHRLGAGARLLLYTDGLLEARDPAGEFFDLLGAAAHLPVDAPAALGPRADAVQGQLEADLDDVFARLRRHVGAALTDDVAALMLQPAGPVGPADPGGEGAASDRVHSLGAG